MANEITTTNGNSRSVGIRNLRAQLPEIGHIKIGEKGDLRRSRDGVEFRLPRKLDHFRVTTMRKGRDDNFIRDDDIHDALDKMYKCGDRPMEIPIRFLYDDDRINFYTRYVCYVNRVLWCNGDGSADVDGKGAGGAIRLSETTQEAERKDFVPKPRAVDCTCERILRTFKKPHPCKFNGVLSCLIDLPDVIRTVGGVWKLRTTGVNATTHIASQLNFYRGIASGVQANLPFVLRLYQKIGNPDGDRQFIYYEPSVEFAGSLDDLRREGEAAARARARSHYNIVHAEEQILKFLQSQPTEAIVSDDEDEIKDYVEEFYPEAVTGDGFEPEAEAAPQPQDFASETPPREPEEEEEEESEEDEEDEEDEVVEEPDEPDEVETRGEEEYEYAFADWEGEIHGTYDPDQAIKIFKGLMKQAANLSDRSILTGLYESNRDTVEVLCDVRPAARQEIRDLHEEIIEERRAKGPQLRKVSSTPSSEPPTTPLSTPSSAPKSSPPTTSTPTSTPSSSSEPTPAPKPEPEPAPSLAPEYTTSSEPSKPTPTASPTSPPAPLPTSTPKPALTPSSQPTPSPDSLISFGPESPTPSTPKSPTQFPSSSTTAPPPSPPPTTASSSPSPSPRPRGRPRKVQPQNQEDELPDWPQQFVEGASQQPSPKPEEDDLVVPWPEGMNEGTWYNRLRVKIGRMRAAGDMNRWDELKEKNKDGIARVKSTMGDYWYGNLERIMYAKDPRQNKAS